jgi:glycine betaine/proline transport system ATP-binding protein
MVQTSAKLSVRELWKVFGPHPERILKSELRNKTRSEVQRETGHVFGLRNVSFDVAEGEVFVVMGLSGSGKSTLVRCLLRLIEPSQGQVLVEGQDILRYSLGQLIQFRRKKVAMVFQRFGLLPHRNVMDNVAFPLEIEGVGRRQRLARAQEALQAVGLEGWEHNMPHELSGGMQQRVGLARALASESNILLMDEPFSALDPLIRREMQAELIRLQEHFKKTIVFITHDLDEATKIGNRIAIMRDGEIVQIGTPEEIVGAPSDEYVAEFTRDVRRAAILRVRSIMLPPVARIFQWQDPRVALNELVQAERNVAFIVDKEERLLGMVTANAVEKAAQAGLPTLTPVLEQAPMVVPADWSLELLSRAVMDYDWRVDVLPVVDDQGKLVGEVHRAAIRELSLPEASRLSGK